MRSGVICLMVVYMASAVIAEQFSFDGYKVWSVSPKTEEHRKALQFWENNENVDFWDILSPTVKPLRIMIAPNTQESFVSFLASAGIEHELTIPNVETIFEEERRVDAEYRVKIGRQPTDARFVPDFNHFWTRLEINNYLTYLVDVHGDICSTQVAGFSYQGQLLRSIIISRQGRGRIDGSRPIVFLDASIHAREWITHSTMMYILHQLVERRNEYLDILDNIDFVILPLVNPDGYEFSRSNYRLWRKTRRPVIDPITGQTCFGIDGNRNYEHMWRSGNDPCSDNYPGTEPFSEPETQAVRGILERYGTNIKMYISVHSCGSYVLYPWGYEGTLIENWQLHDDIGRIFADAIFESTGRNYTVGNAAIALYPAFGASDDYAASVGVETSYTFELPCGGPNGYDLPASQIYEVVTETWTGFSELLRFAAAHEWSEDFTTNVPVTEGQ